MKQHIKHQSIAKRFLRSAFLIITLCLLTNAIHAQIFVSVTHRDYYTYNDDSEELEFSNGYDENSMFKINSKLTMFEHTTPEMSSSYYVRSNSEYDEDNNKLTMDVTSDVGNDYRYIFDFREEKVSVLFKRNGEIKVLIFTMKKYWTKDND